MSAIYFHSKEHERVSVGGAERAHMARLICDVMLAAIGDLELAAAWLKPLLPPEHPVQHSVDEEFARQAEVLLRSGKSDCGLYLPSGKVEPWIVGLNTALALGGNALKLCARLHGQCEAHCWIEGAGDKSWLAEIIATGLANGPLRSGRGWDQVIALLGLAGDFPVVCSYSVGESFPNFECLPAGHALKKAGSEDLSDAFYDIPTDEAWTLCMEGLRSSGGRLRFTKHNWDDFRFGNGASAFNLRERSGQRSGD